MKRWIAVLVVAVVAFGTAGSGVAGAAPHASTVKISGYTIGFFTTQVKSSFGGCKHNRRVEVWKHTMSGDKFVNFDKTDQFGRADVLDLDNLGGTYFPIARKITGKFKGHKFKCPNVTGPDFTR